MRLADTTTLDAGDPVSAQLVLVPVGSLEQHGPHLPLDTDTVIATAVATAVGDQLGAWVAPALAYGSSGEHQSFAGTSSIGTDALRTTVVELVRSLRTWADRVVLVNGHGGNLTALSAAVEQLTTEGHAVAWVPCATELVDLHAGRTETSLMLHLSPWTVRQHLAEPGDTRPLGEILPLMREGGVAAVSPNGVLGDPTGATAAEGQRVLQAMVDDVLRRIGAPVP
ncbi:mycofactocin biosynthesis peptidyl-dipeptidase MftE [Nocardioides sp.]|uniref:mycofactocin biosynthesis peptidyl-dipeptidase MftE n=1 Tax=Nocardioides sp. TaxID=35761 RepID=UPI0027217DCA|nr:mycofactocin biosynthesis peptidyl-dipeptidase MftE [Nocardioides sp.]MDO9458305.1 mycofactocin biosynthesis peptidyl-dipeptidase MftE [Nocardioides sp.]